jgi:hypothetical protein
MANGVGANGVGANGVGANGVGANGVGANINKIILLEKWHLHANGTINAWVSHSLHHLKYYESLNACYTGRTYGRQAENSTILIEYEYTIPLTQLKQRNVKWQWQGIYSDDIIVEFNIEQHIQEYPEYKPEQAQSLKEITAIISKLNEPVKEIYIPHNFRISEGVVLCQHCGELLSDLKTTFKKGCAKALL